MARVRKIVGAWAGVLIAAALAPGATPDEARTLWKAGKYAEAQEAYEALAKAPDLKPDAREAIALGLADCLVSQGQSDKALATLAGIKPVESPDTDAKMAEILFAHGDWDGAATAAKAARAMKDDHLLARWIEARLLEAQGKLAPDGQDWKWFIDYQNGHNDTLAKDPMGLLIVGQAAERYYRANATGQELGEGLNDVINTLYEAALKADPQCWQRTGSKGSSSSPATRKATPARP